VCVYSCVYIYTFHVYIYKVHVYKYIVIPMHLSYYQYTLLRRENHLPVFMCVYICTFHVYKYIVIRMNSSYTSVPFSGGTVMCVCIRVRVYIYISCA